MNYIKKMSIYFLGSFSSAFVSFVFLPLYTNKFSVSDYGSYDFTYSIITMLVSVVFMEIWVAILRFTKDDINNGPQIFVNALVIAAILITPFAATHFLFSRVLNLAHVVTYIVFGILILLQHCYQFYLRGIDHIKTYLFSGIGTTIIQALISLYFLFFTDVPAISIVYSNIIARIIIVVIIEIKYKLLIKIKFENLNCDLIKKIVRFSLPFSINALAYWGMTNINRVFANQYLDNEANGYIGVVLKFVYVLSLVSSTFILVWQEHSFSEANSESKNESYSQVLNNLMLVSSLALVMLVPLTYMVFPFIINFKYHKSLILIPMYYIATYFGVYNSYFGQIFSAEKKTLHLTYSTIVGALVNVGLLFFMVPNYGIIGIPISLAVGTLFNVLIRYLLIRNYVKFSINIKIFVSSIIVSSSVLIYYLNIPLLYKYIISIGFIVLFLLISGGTIIKMIKNIFKKKELKV